MIVQYLIFPSYGERGFEVINSLLLHMFGKALQYTRLPCSAASLIEGFLVPEATILLIQEDKGIDRTAAMTIRCDSSSWGIAKYPALDFDPITAKFHKLAAEMNRRSSSQFLA